MSTRLLRPGAFIACGSFAAGIVGAVALWLAWYFHLFANPASYSVITTYGAILVGAGFAVGLLLIFLGLVAGPLRNAGKMNGTSLVSSEPFGQLRQSRTPQDSESVSLYLDLLKKCVGNFIYDDDLNLRLGKVQVDPVTGKITTTEGTPFEAQEKYYGAIWPSRAHSMIGMPRLDNIQYCVEEVLRTGVPGDLIEAGVWRGGATILMRGILKAHGITDRIVWVADSFEGLPPADLHNYPKESKVEFHLRTDLAVSLDEVRTNFKRYGLLDDQVRFLKGWFRDTLPTAPIEKLAIMRLDGDMYESTMDGLVNLYPKLSPGGFVIIDDYQNIQECEAAVQDYRKKWGITSELYMIPGCGAFWQKQS
jgi:hypothetical protein